MRLIDADALIEQLMKEPKVGRLSFEAVLNAVKNMKPIEERKTGKWVKVHGYCTPGGDPVWCCSECGKGTHVYGIEHGTYGADVADGQWVACPNCGTVMEE